MNFNDDIIVHIKVLSVDGICFIIAVNTNVCVILSCAQKTGARLLNSTHILSVQPFLCVQIISSD